MTINSLYPQLESFLKWSILERDHISITPKNELFC